MTSTTFSKKHFSLLTQVALAALVGASPALAQTVPSSVDASQVDRRFKPAPAPLESNVGLPLPGEPRELPKAQQESLSKVKFTLKAVKVEGNKALTDTQLASAYDDMVGKKISLLDAQTIARKITAMYQKEGYVLSQAVVPQQSVNNGTLTIRVVEGYVSSIVVQGDVSESERERVISYLSNIRNQRPVTTQAMERNLLLINDLPGASVKGLLRPAAGEFGAAELVVTVSRKRYDAVLATDNRGSKYIGPWQHSVTVGANSVFGLYDRTQLRLTTSSPTTELRGFELQHDEMIGNQGTKLSLLGSRTHTEPGDSLKNIDIVGDSDLIEAKLSHPFIRSRQENLVGRALFDYRNSDTDIFHNLNFTEDRLRVGRIGGTYNFFDSWQGSNLFDLQLSQGFNIFNASDKGTARTNALGESDFTKINFDASRTQSLPSNFSLYAAATGQYSFDPLLVSEQFSLGGANFGTAYDPADVLGDSGIAGKLELRYNQQPGYRYFNAYQLFTYYDIGQAWIRKGAPGANDKRNVSSAGAGIRTSFNETVSSTLEFGVPLTRPASNQGDHGNDARIFFGTTARF